MRLNLTSQTIWHTSDMNECLPLPLYARHTKTWISQGVDWISTASGSERSLRQRSLATARGTDSSSQSRSWCAQHIHKIYRVLPDEDAAVDGAIRIVDESGEDYLYPADWFVLVKLPQIVEESLLRAA